MLHRKDKYFEVQTGIYANVFSVFYFSVSDILVEKNDANKKKERKSSKKEGDR